MPKGYLNLEQIATIDFLNGLCYYQVNKSFSNPSEEIFIFTIKNIEFKLKNFSKLLIKNLILSIKNWKSHETITCVLLHDTSKYECFLSNGIIVVELISFNIRRFSRMFVRLKCACYHFFITFSTFSNALWCRFILSTTCNKNLWTLNGF